MNLALRELERPLRGGSGRIVAHSLDDTLGRQAAERLGVWQLHRASTRPLLGEAWSYRHNMTAADALYVVLAEELSAEFLIDVHNLVEAPTFPRTIKCSNSQSGLVVGSLR